MLRAPRASAPLSAWLFSSEDALEFLPQKCHNIKKNHDARRMQCRRPHGAPPHDTPPTALKYLITLAAGNCFARTLNNNDGIFFFEKKTSFSPVIDVTR